MQIHTAYVGMPHTETMPVKAGEVGVSLWRTNHRALMESLERKIVTGSNQCAHSDRPELVGGLLSAKQTREASSGNYQPR
jgi:hypothetical protein